MKKNRKIEIFRSDSQILHNTYINININIKININIQQISAMDEDVFFLL